MTTKLKQLNVITDTLDKENRVMSTICWELKQCAQTDPRGVLWRELKRRIRIFIYLNQGKELCGVLEEE